VNPFDAVSVRAAVVIAALALAAAHALGAGKTMTAVLSEDARTLSYTPCSEDEAAECIAYALDCRTDNNFGGLRVTLMGDEASGPNVRSLAKALLARPFGEARMHVAPKGKPVDLQVTAFTVSQNEMDGDWMLDLHTYQQQDLFDALDRASAASVKLEVEGYSVTLSDGPKTAERLLRFASTCRN
jgi:hypothetical protein